MKLTENFSKSEFDSKDGSEMPCEVLENIKELATNLQELRNYLKVPIRINSGYRSPEHNKSIGGVKNSQHVLGKASDVATSTFSPEQIKDAILFLISKGRMKNGGIGIYNTFVHYDIRETPARWDNRS